MIWHERTFQHASAREEWLAQHCLRYIRDDPACDCWACWEDHHREDHMTTTTTTGRTT